MQEILNFLISLIIYVAIFACIIQLVKKYRQLNKSIDKNLVKSDDPFSISFIEKIFYFSGDDPKVSKLQKSIIRYSALILLLLFCGRVFL